MFLEAIKRKAVFYLFVIALMVFAAPFSDISVPGVPARSTVISVSFLTLS